ncbi:MAG: hypothetical protein ABEK12_02215, partial [Candidatus Nanohaloarchaea archaeon]
MAALSGEPPRQIAETTVRVPVRDGSPSQGGSDGTAWDDHIDRVRLTDRDRVYGDRDAYGTLDEELAD